MSILLIACGNKAEEENHQDPTLVEVDLQLQETAEVNEDVTIKAVVTYGDEKVTDADKVLFGIREDSEKDESVKIEAKHSKDGIYEIQTKFAADGIYHVTAHTDAKKMHVMPSKKITVGHVEDHGDDHGDDHSNHGSVDGFMLHFMEPENVQVNEETGLVVHLGMNDSPLVDARVRYEIWQGDSEKHEFLEAKEDVKGEYTANYTFAESGEYNVKIHVEAEDDLHEHEEYIIDVK